MIHKLFSPKTGIIKQINELMRNADQPRLQYMVSTMCNSSRFCSQLNDVAATGVALDRTSAWWSALGEGIERYCAVFSNIYPQYFSSYSELKRAGINALPPKDFLLFSDTQYQDEGFRYVKPDEHSRLYWIEGKTLPEHSSCYIPSALVFNAYQSRVEEKIVPNIHPGIACGSDRNKAIIAALFEIIERDSMMIWWLNQLSMPGIKIAPQNQLRKIITHNFPQLATESVNFSFVWLKNDLDIPVIFCLLIDPKAQVVSGGCAARLNPTQALFKAFCEAAQTWLLALDLKRGEGGNIAALARKGLFPKEAVAPTMTSSGTNVLHNLLTYTDPSSWDILNPIRNPIETVMLSDLPTFTAIKGTGTKSKLDFILDQLQKRKLVPITVDLTSSDIAEVGLWVVRVSIPGMVPNTPTLYPPLGLQRLYDLPITLGFDRKKIKEKTWNLAPLPYS